MSTPSEFCLLLWIAACFLVGVFFFKKGEFPLFGLVFLVVSGIPSVLDIFAHLTEAGSSLGVANSGLWLLVICALVFYYFSIWRQANVKLFFFLGAINVFILSWGVPEWSPYLGVALILYASFILEGYLRVSLTKPVVVFFLLYLSFEMTGYCFEILSGQIWQDKNVFRIMLAAAVAPFVTFTLKNGVVFSTRFVLPLTDKHESNVVFLSGAYFILISAFSYFMEITGQAGLLLPGVFMFTFFIVIVVLIRFVYWRGFVVKLHKKFMVSGFDYRSAWLKTMDALSETTSADQASLAGLSCLSTELRAKEAAFCSWNGGEVNVNGSLNLSVPTECFSSLVAMKEYVRETRWVIDLFEMQNSPDKYPGVVPELHFRWPRDWWLIPVLMADDVPGFFLICRDNMKSPVLNWETKDFSLAMTKQIWYHYTSEINRQKLTEQAQFIAFYQTSAFVIHDLKNLDAQLGMITENAKEHGEDIEFARDTYKTIGGMQKRLAKTLAQLRSKMSERAGDELDPVNWLSGLKSKLVNKKIALNVTGDPKLLDGVPSRVMKVISHLIDNSVEAMERAPIPFVELDMADQDDALQITIRDNGCGMSEDFINNHLFKPFHTTKGNAGMGLGLFEARQFILDLGGKIVVDSELWKGTQIRMVLPTNK